MRLDEIGESGLIDHLQTLTGVPEGRIVVGICDDAAAIMPVAGQLALLTTDALVENVHFDLSYFSLYQVGWRAMTANLSDIAAMGGVPEYALVSIAVPQGYTLEEIETFYKGMLAVAEKYDTKIIGGDSTRSPASFFVSITLFGHVNKSNLKCRSAARPGEGVFVTGDLGASHAGMLYCKSAGTESAKPVQHIVTKHLTPLPRIKEALYLVQQFQIGAMTDVSDGLAAELSHICRQSKVGARIEADLIPIHRETRAVAVQNDQDVWDYALCGGEDYELVFTAPVQLQDDITDAMQKNFGCKCTCVGAIVAESEGVYMKKGNGGWSSLPTTGFDHFTKPGTK